MKKKNIIIYIGAFLIISGLLLSLLFDEDMGGRIANIITITTAILGAVALLIQFKKDKEINEASFILDLSYHFTDQKGLKEMLIKLDSYNKGNKNALTDEDYINIVFYLEWCEELAAIVNQKLIDVEWMDDFFSYKFFLITNNEYVQKKELVQEFANYKGIYKLHKEWTAYKKQHNLPIIQEETSLAKTENYNK